MSVVVELNVKRRPGVCKHCVWNTGPLKDCCDHPKVKALSGLRMIKTQLARDNERMCGNGQSWQAKP